jgi:hypothetical protein
MVSCALAASLMSSAPSPIVAITILRFHVMIPLLDGRMSHTSPSSEIARMLRAIAPIACWRRLHARSGTILHELVIARSARLGSDYLLPALSTRRTSQQQRSDAGAASAMGFPRSRCQQRDIFGSQATVSQRRL